MPFALCAISEEDLLPLALGQPASDGLQIHVTNCSDCQERLQQIKKETSTLQKAFLEVTRTDISASKPRAGAEERDPATIGKYFVVGKLGQGAQATAYRALHPVLHKELVIKYARERSGAAVEDRNRLIQEGRILADLDHPNLARVLDLDFHEDRVFLVMEYHRGVNLEQHLAQHKLRPREIASLIIPLAKALGVAHRRGIVHQDIKPANLLIDENGKPFILDFGLARLCDAWSAAAEQPAGGTVAYMSPEQARGDGPKIGAASDIFSLGAVLYFLLTGNPPFQAGTWHEAMKNAGRCEFDSAALRKPGIPSRLAAICLKAMDAEPAKRYLRAEDLAGDLERYLRRPRQTLVWGMAASLLVAAGALWQFWPTAEVPPLGKTPPVVQPVELAQPPGQQHLITAIRRTQKGNAVRHKIDTIGDLARVGLKSGDIVVLNCEVPRDFRTAFFVVNATGEVRELEPLQINTVGAFDKIRFPAERDWQIEGLPGPVIFLACSDRKAKPSLEDVRKLVQENGDKPIRLPVPEEEDYLFLFDRSQELEEARGLIETSRSRLRDRLERLRGKAASQIDYIWGVALPLR